MLVAVTLLLGRLTNVAADFHHFGANASKWWDDSIHLPPVIYTGDPLFLTPLIQRGMLRHAKDRARVYPNWLDVPSYAGYFTVNEPTGSNMFFWFFPNQKLPSAPVVLWLEGGPGFTSLHGAFLENGPYMISGDGELALRNISWTKKFHMLYIDNPVGTGYSFTTHEKGFATDEDTVGRDLFDALQQFFTLFGEYSDNELYMAGSSYAGKFIPAAARVIHEYGNEAKMKLTGMIFGNSPCDPVTMLNYADFMLQIGVVSQRQADEVRSLAEQARESILLEDYRAALEYRFDILEKYMHFSGSKYVFNYLRNKEPPGMSRYYAFMQASETRKAIHVGNMPFHPTNRTVYRRLTNDRMQSIKPWIAQLMEHYRVTR